jgi:DNA-binding protein
MQKNDNEVLVGKKPIIRYVFAVLTQLTNGQKEIHVKARGKNISKAVDVVEIVRRRHLQNLKLKDIKIGTEERENQGKKMNVSTIDIVLAV